MAKRFGLFTVLTSALSLAGCATHPAPRVKLSGPGEVTGFIRMTTSAGDATQGCVLYVPAGYDPEKAWPLVVFLHGMGERGTDGVRQTEVGIGPAILDHPERFPCLVLMPQCPPDSIWAVSRERWAEGSHGAMDHVDDGIRQVLDHYRVDTSRISLTGLSMGGYGTFSYGARNADHFSAFMPVCGGGDPEDAGELARRPVWAFHGADDPVVPPTRSQEMVDAIRRAGGEARYTVFPGTGHNSWDQAYGMEEAIRWLLLQRND